MKNHCEELHQLCKNLTRYRYTLNNATLLKKNIAKKTFPKNGIYILFEDGEEAHGTDRIVRIGSHTGQNNLKKRLLEHFYTEKKDRSIFRKNIGRALLQKKHDDYLAIWNIDFTTKKNKEEHGHKIDRKKENEIEKQVSDYIREHISFVVIQVDEKEQRLELEASIISTVSLCEECKASTDWLGISSPKESIRTGKLWQEQGVVKLLTAEDMQFLQDVTHA